MAGIGGIDPSIIARLSNDLTRLTADERRELAQLVQARIEYTKLTIQYDELKLAFLLNPTREAQKAFEDYAAVTVHPARAALGKESRDVLKMAVDVEALMRSIPMLMAIFTQAINLPLLLNAINVDPTQVTKALETFQELAQGKLFDGDDEK
jgi:hypothetical protein